MPKRIADLPDDDQPRERMLRHGPATLSTSELLAIVLGAGAPGKNVMQLARELVRNGVRELGRRDVQDLSNVYGMGQVKALRVRACFELARRLQDHEVDEIEPPVYEAQVLGTLLIAEMCHHTQERLGAAFLDARHRVLTQREIYIGTIDHALVSTRDVVRYALFDNAAGVVLYHNHPSGTTYPSSEDHVFTRQIQHSLELFDLELVDHLIIGQKRFFSFGKEGMLAKRVEKTRCA